MGKEREKKGRFTGIILKFSTKNLIKLIFLTRHSNFFRLETVRGLFGAYSLSETALKPYVPIWGSI